MRQWTSDCYRNASRPKLELPPLKLGPITVDTPVILAPMAGITNSAFRRLCREYGGGLYVAEMVTSRALVERTPESLRIISHDDDEKVRSVQLYGVDPVTVGQAVRMLVEEDRADHIDLNFGCPVPKVTRRGGGSALPWKTDLFTSIVQTAVKEASKGNVPLTIKMRKGIDDDHLTYLDAGRIARDAGSPPSRFTAAPRRSSTPARPTGPRSPACARRCRTSLCWATATSGPLKMPSAWSGKPAWTEWWWAAAARAAHGCSETSWRPSKEATSATSRTCTKWPRASTGMPN
ncbi:probable tRNA-dihydrouridine synthase [Arthrobacter sp. Hiyo4]|nr:probable tRNA-dihydrouridine synthase [Arthrobacter sp. Hiyo4]